MAEAQDDFVLLDRDDASDFNEANILPESPASIDQILSWLKPTAYDSEGSEFTKHLTSHVDGTGAWLTSTEKYIRWHKSADQGLLWIKGAPGSGKSVFAASLAKQFANEGVPVLYFFFRQIIDANHLPISLLRDWLCQILRYSPPLQAKFSGYVKAKRSLESLSIDNLFEDLRLALSHQSRVYAVADALDEMDDGNEAFIRTLGELGLYKPGRVKLLLTSRPVPAVESALRNLPSLQIRLEESLVDLDIVKYVAHRLLSSSIGPSDQDLIRKAIPGRANGLFLYAKLALDAFLERGARVQEVLKNLPADLNTMYTDLLHEHARRSRLPQDLQLLILQWVTHANRPLRLLELAEMLQVTSPEHRGEDLKATKALVRSTCGPLIEILQDGTVSVIHHSLTEFLKGTTKTAEVGVSQKESYPVLFAGSSHARLALSCLMYLQSGPLDEQKLTQRRRRDEDFDPFNKNTAHSEWKMKFPFLDYSTCNWYTHIVKATLHNVPRPITDRVCSELDSLLIRSQRFSAWLDLVWPGGTDENLTALHVAAWAGLKDYTQILLSRAHVSVNTEDSKKNTALHYAAMEGHSEIAAMLISRGAELDVDNRVGLKPLHCAASNNRAGVVKLLLSRGVDPLTPKTRETGVRRCGNARSSIGETPLMYACESGHSETVGEFLPFLKADDVHRALSWASAGGHSNTVAVLLGWPGLSVNKLSAAGRSALFEACRALDRDTIRLLLDAGADPNQRSQNCDDRHSGLRMYAMPNDHEMELYQRGFTPMHAFAGAGSRHKRNIDADESASVLQMLLKAGGQVDIRDREGRTPLFYACRREEFSWNEDNDHVMARLFLEAGADANVSDKNGETLLHLAVHDRSGSLIRILVEQAGANINAKTSDGRTPLLCLVGTQHIDSTLRFLQYNPNTSAADHKGNGPLHYIMKDIHRSYSSKHEGAPTRRDIIKLLVSQGADPTRRNHNGDTPIHMYTDATLDLVSVILDAGASLEAKNYKGETALFKATGGREYNWRPIVQKFIDLGSRIDTVDRNGRCLLHEAVRTESTELFDFLLGNGVNPLTNDSNGRSLIHEFAGTISTKSWYNDNDQKAVAMAHKLVALGIDADMPDNDGLTALHLIVSTTSSSYRSGRLRPIDVILGICKRVDAQDHHGTTPLHLASTASQFLVARLLAAGADLQATTFENLTPLHLAARACQSNILGILLDEIRMKAPDRLSQIVNSKDKRGRTPLHYACRSGRPESVQLLLQAGANPNLFDSSGESTLRICTEFEENQGPRQYRPSRCNDIIHASSTRIDETCARSRPSNRQHMSFSWPVRSAHEFTDDADTTRLEEIVDLLIEYHIDLNSIGRYKMSALERALQNAVYRGGHHAVAVFDNVQRRLQCAESSWINTRFDYLCAKKTNIAAEDAFQEWRTVCRRDNLENKEIVLKELLHMRQYELVEKIMLSDTDTISLDSNGQGVLPLLARHGFDRLLATISNPELAQKFDDHTACGKLEGDHRKASIKPLLIVACERALPNMNVVKVLIEILKVDVNALQRENQHSTGVSTAGTVLHGLALGREWWHVRQALPYLLDAGADLEARNEYLDGRTPLQVALSNSQSGCFNREAAKLLIKCGADVNAVDNTGQSCLAIARADIELVELLVKAGANITPAAIFAAIDSRDSRVVETYLEYGADPNKRRTKIAGLNKDCDIPSNQILDNGGGVVEEELYPLHYAALYEYYNRQWRHFDTSGSEYRERSTEVVRMLLKHGANPYRTFLERGCGLSGRPEDINERTVLHDIIKRGKILEPFLLSTALDVECRDANGETPFLAACGSSVGPDESINVARELGGAQDVGQRSIASTLLDRGANVRAADNLGNNALHIMLEQPAHKYDHCSKTVKIVLDLAPDLLRQKNKAGETPFHYALQNRSIDCIASLLEMGADASTSDADGKTILHHLSTRLGKGNEKAMPLFTRLLGEGISISARENRGETPLSSLVRASPSSRWTPANPRPATQEDEPYRRYIQFHVDAGANLLACNDAGETLLHIVAARTYDERFSHPEDDRPERDLELFKYLMGLGLDPMAEDKQQRTSLDVAAACQNTLILKLFELRYNEQSSR